MYISIDTPGFFDMADFDGEYWKNLYGFEDNYEISNYGRIKRKHRVWHSGRNGSQVKEIYPSIVAQRRLKMGYIKVTLCQNGIKKSYSVHVLVARTFIDNPENKPVVNHKDFNKDNNCVDNLEWVTYSENSRHWVNNSGFIFSFKNRLPRIAKSKAAEVTKIFIESPDLTVRQVANKTGVTYCQAYKLYKKIKHA